MKQLKMQQPVKVALPEDLYAELLELHAQGVHQDVAFQSFVTMILHKGLKVYRLVEEKFQQAFPEPVPKQECQIIPFPRPE